jgi:DEAD/DEAH box helicase domain-containing protein
MTLSSFDILEDIRSKIGRRLALNDVAFATLGKKKSGHGLMAIDYYKEGKIEELKKYCLDDVMITKELFDFGVKYGEVHYMNEAGRNIIRVDWKKYIEENGKAQTELTLPF